MNPKFFSLCGCTSVLIRLIAVSSLVLAAVATAEPLPDSAAKMDQALVSAFHADAPGAAVLVVQNGNVILRKGYGLADLELRVPMDAAQVLPICSITKQFTAVAILQLVQAGKLKLSDELGQYVADYPTGSARVTIEELLTHTAGIPSIEEEPEARKKWRDDLTPVQWLDYTRNKPLGFVPGTNWKYSNTGYCLLGLVIEKISGQSYPDYILTHLFAPAGMTHSAYPDGKRIIPNRARGYSRSGKEWIDAPYYSPTLPYSAGALLASVDDLWAWERALQSGALLDQDLLQRAYTEGHLPDGRATHYGFGWEIIPAGARRMIGHAGGMLGFAAFEARVPEAGLYVAILCNTDVPSRSLRVLTTLLVHLALGESITDTAATITLSPDALQKFAGSYQMAPGSNFVVTVKDAALYGQLGPGRRPLKAVAPDEFADAKDEMHFRFVRDQTQHVTQVLVATDGAGPELVWSRSTPSNAVP